MTYILPASTTPLPGSLTLTQFVQSVLKGISGVAGDLVRPRWQVSPPKQPDITTNWIAFSINTQSPDANAYLEMDAAGVYRSQRHETLQVQCAFYGPLALDYAYIVRDGFQIPQNLEALRSANMGFVETGPATQVPDMVNERWVERYEMSVILRREIQRTYPVVSLVQAVGTIDSQTSGEDYSSGFETPTS